MNENDGRFTLGLTVLEALHICRETGEVNGFKFIPQALFCASLFVVPETPMEKYLRNVGVVGEVLEERVLYYINSSFVEDYECDCEILPLLTKNNGQVEFIIEKSIMKIMKEANVIAHKLYLSHIIETNHMISAFAQVFPEDFMDCMKTLYPEFDTSTNLETLDIFNPDKPETSKDDFTLPKEVEGFLTVLNDQYDPDSKECEILGREKETEKLSRILRKSTKRNVVLLGEAGVGKSALAERFTWMIVTKNCPKEFFGCVVVSLDVSMLIANTKYRGQAEEKISNLVNFLENNPKVILFIDEAHEIVGAGACKEGEADLSNTMKPMLARGKSRVICATTEDEYKKYFATDKALKRRFEPVYVKEPNHDEVYDMIKNKIRKLEEFHGVRIDKSLVDNVILYASCFNYETKNPDRTLDLLDKAMVAASDNNHKKVELADILDVFDAFQEQYDNFSEDLKKSLAYHEAGHYILHRFSTEVKEVNVLAVSIIPAEDYLGVNVLEADRKITPNRTKEYYIQSLGCLLGGRCAEKRYSHKITAGASSDLEKATRIAKDMLTRYALISEFTEDRVYLRESSNPMYNDKLIDILNGQIDAVLQEAKTYTNNLLEEKKVYLDALVKALIKKGIMSSIEIDELFRKIDRRIEEKAKKNVGAVIDHAATKSCKISTGNVKNSKIKELKASESKKEEKPSDEGNSCKKK